MRYVVVILSTCLPFIYTGQKKRENDSDGNRTRAFFCPFCKDSTAELLNQPSARRSTLGNDSAPATSKI